MKIHIWNEYTIRSGQVCDDPEAAGDDVHLWGEGSPEELAKQARERLTHRFDTRPGVSLDAFEWRCAKNVLKELGEPLPEYDSKAQVYQFTEENSDVRPM